MAKGQETAETIDRVREKLNRARAALKGEFTGKDELVDLLFIGAAAQEPVLLVGPPGTAKSDLVVRFAEAIGVAGEDYFEYMLTRFTEPSEIFGPVDLAKLRAGEYWRRTAGKLPEASVVFLDEIFKANSAILNALLTVINERKFYQAGRPHPVQLKVLFAAANEVAPEGDLAALRDRFPLKALSDNVWERDFDALVRAGLRGDTARALGQKPWAQGLTTLDDLLALRGYFDRQTQRQLEGRTGVPLDQQLDFEPDALAQLQVILRACAQDLHLELSDRKVVKLIRLLRIRALLFHGGRVSTDDLTLLRYLGSTRAELTAGRELVDQILQRG